MLALPASGQMGAEATADSAAAEEADDEPGWRFIHINELETPFMTFRVGGGVLVDYNTFAQDEESEEQVDMSTELHFRDTRVILGGVVKTERPVIWQAGFMYDTKNDKWLVRQTGVIVAVPEISGRLWIGRSKEGVSLNRVMVGYDGWTEERFPFSDASIPLLADGVKWLGYAPGKHLVWNLGVFTDAFSEGQTFSYYQSQVAGRIAYVRFDSVSAGNLVHVGLGGRIGLPANDTLHLKSKPEATFAPNFVDTGKFRSELAGEIGIEAYYRPGPLLIGAEYYVEAADFGGRAGTVAVAEPDGPVDDLRPAMRMLPSRSPVQQDGTDQVFFHGGGAVVTWLLTGETRSYLTASGSFDAVSPARPVSERGWGALEAVLQLSYTDLDSGSLTGGKFWRITPMLNWHLTDNVRLEAAYGYGVLSRFDLTGRTHFFQTRIQTQL